MPQPRPSAHAFKSGASNVRAKALAALLESAESAGSAGNVIEAQSLVPTIEIEFERLSAYLRAHLADPNRETAQQPTG